MNCELQDKIFNTGKRDFDALALEVFRYQYTNNDLYRLFVNTLHIDPASVNSVASIPFLPVSFFKSHLVMTGSFVPELEFESSGTTMTGNSRHLVKSAKLYQESFLKAFEIFYGPVADWCIIGLLPSYLERKNSSLVVMVNDLIEGSHHESSGFYLYEHNLLADALKKNEERSQKTLLIGVTFALLDFAEEFNHPLKNTIVMETGGMKGRRKEITRPEVHEILKSSWQLDSVHAEYGMTELLSQAYSSGNGIFKSPPWMKVLLRDEDDPLTIKFPHSFKTVNGLVNIVDLANIHSCSFIAVDDIGKLHSDGSFEIMGRMDSSDVRGCNLLYES